MFRNQFRRGTRAVKAAMIRPACAVKRGSIDPDLLQRHGRARPAGDDTGTGQEADARDRAALGRRLHRATAADGRCRIAAWTLLSSR